MKKDILEKRVKKLERIIEELLRHLKLSAYADEDLGDEDGWFDVVIVKRKKHPWDLDCKVLLKPPPIQKTT